MDVRRGSPRRLAVAAAVIASLFVAATASATVVVPVSRASMTAGTDLIVRATVGGRQSRWNEDGSQIISLTELHVTQWIKGNGPETTLVLRQFGGRVGNLESRIAGDPQLEAGKDVVLFLRRGDGPVVYLYAMAQSVYYVEHTRGGRTTVRRDLDGLTFAMRDNGQLRLMEAGHEGNEPLDAFLTELRSLVGGAR